MGVGIMVMRRKYSYTKARRVRYLKENRGQGSGASYKPWINVQDIPSIGRSTRVHSVKTGRTHHFLSDLETNYFYLFDWQENVIDIREQYPLQRQITIDIAQKNGIKHQQDNFTKEYIDLTTDFLLTVLDSNGNHVLLAITVKYCKDLDNNRVLEKFEIERRYWELKNVEWRIVTELDLPKVIVENIKWCRSFMNTDSVRIDQAHVTSLFKSFSSDESINLATISKQQDSLLNLESGSTLKLIKYLLATKQIKINKYCCWMTEATAQDLIINLKSVNSLVKQTYAY